MSIKKRNRIKFRARLKRKSRRAKLKRAGKDPESYFYSGIYVGETNK
ncbi:MAG: hypothetical protein JW800_04070 [Candidatus Omnitrophica bacterium]|nr:hypothetical protein [Candidatus Omnitrophota bacterium]